MGQFAKDWESVKAIIRQKDDAIDKLTQQLNAVQSNLASIQKSLDAANLEIGKLKSQFDDADLAAINEVDTVVAENPIERSNPIEPSSPVVNAPPTAPDAAPAPKPAVVGGSAAPVPADTFAKPAAAPSMTTFTK